MNTSIPQTDPHASYLAYKREIDSAITRVLESGWYILGQEVSAFESEFATFVGCSFGISVANGTDALALGLRALNVGPGDGVITVSHTAVATVAAIESIGAIPILLDIDQGYTMSVEQLESVLCHPPLPVKCIIPVHLYGQPAAIDDILWLASKSGIPVLEDCCQAHGATWGDRAVGTFGRIAAFSMYPTKNLGAFGDAGMLLTNDEALASRLKALRQYGWKDRYISYEIGQNSRLDEIQAAILRVKLLHLAKDNVSRQAIAHEYDIGLTGLAVDLPWRRPLANHVFHQYVIRHANRGMLQKRLSDQGIMTNIHYPVPVHLQPAYFGRSTLGPGGLPVSEAIARQILSLPMYPQMSIADIRRVVHAMREAV